MQPHQERVVQELSDLTAKQAALGSFIGTALYSYLPVDEQRDLQEQLIHMRNYVSCLARRVARFP